MNYLLDTSVFIWWSEDPTKLSPTAQAICANAEHNRYVSIASIWEMQIKAQIGKLTLQNPLAQLISKQMQYAHMQILPVSLEHVYTLQYLALNNHRDPFDRIMIAQAIHEKMLIVSSDSQFAQYPIQIIW